MNLKVIAIYVLVCLTWGLTWFAIRVGLLDFPPFFAAGLRFTVASIVLGFIIYYKKYPVQLDKESIFLYLFMAVFSFLLPFGCVYWGEQYIGSGLAAVLFAIYPFSVLITTKIAIPDEEIKSTQVIGMVLGFAGIVIIFSNSLSFDFSNQLGGMVAVLASALMQSIVVVAVKKHGKNLHPAALNFAPMALGAIAFFVVSPLLEDRSKIHFTMNGIYSVLYLGIFGSVFAFSAYYWLLKRISIILLSLIAFITPVVALFVGWLFLGEQLESRETLGSVFVLAGLLAGNAHVFIQKRNHKA